MPRPCSLGCRHSPDANSHIILWLEVVIAGMIQTLILWFFQVNEIGNPHCKGQRDEVQVNGRGWTHTKEHFCSSVHSHTLSSTQYIHTPLQYTHLPPNTHTHVLTSTHPTPQHRTNSQKALGAFLSGFCNMRSTLQGRGKAKKN